MLQIKNLEIIHTKDLRTLIKDFNIVLNSGDKAAVIGEEGNGKSTLLKLIYDENIIEDYIEYHGEIIRNGMKFGYLAQELSREQLNMTVYEFMCELPTFYDVSFNELAKTAKQFQLSPEFYYSDQFLYHLSGGEKVKLQLSRILLGGPDMLLLDEPSNDIDIETLEWLEKFINQCKLPILYISHDEMLLENTANMIIHIEQLKKKMESKVTVQRCDYTEYVEKRVKGIERQNRVAQSERRDYERQQEKFKQIRQKVQHQQENISRSDPHGGALLKKMMHRLKAYEGRYEKNFENMTEIVETEDAIFLTLGCKEAIPNGKKVIDYKQSELSAGDRILSRNIRLQIYGPQKICIIGHNGSGKTTLLKNIAAEMLPRTDLKVFYMPQNYEELLDMNQMPVEFISEIGDKEEMTKIRTYLGSMKYTRDEMNHRIGDLSGGQKAKIFFLKMALSDYNVLILDEPTRNFSPLSNPVIRHILADFKGSIISVSHDRKYIQEVADVVYRLTDNGLERVEQ